jgi:hypothetical protein
MGELEGTTRTKSTRVSQSQGLSRLMCRKSAGMMRGSHEEGETYGYSLQTSIGGGKDSSG